jgi:hypothetical protein
MPIRATQRRTAKKPAKRKAPLPYAEFAKLAPKLKPAQSWYDETTDPFKAQAKRKPR